MFNDMYDRIDISYKTKLKVFFIMLKRLALNYYYLNMINNDRLITFDNVYVLIMHYFEETTYKKSIMNK